MKSQIKFLATTKPGEAAQRVGPAVLAERQSRLPERGSGLSPGDVVDAGEPVRAAVKEGVSDPLEALAVQATLGSVPGG